MRQIAIIFLALSSCAGAAEVDLKAIIANPQRFDGQEIKTSGLAGDAGNGLYLFPDFTTAAKSVSDVSHSAYLRGNFKLEDNRCWFDVTGIVRSSRRRLWGDPSCVIEIKSIHKLYREKRVLWPKDMGIFQNATSIKVSVDADLSDGGSIGTQPSPNQTGEIRIDSGEVISFEDWSATGTPKTMFKVKVQLPSRKPKDPSDRDFHFVIHKKRLEAIDPNVRVEKIRDLYKSNQ